jgi:hypothetical protein
MFKLYEVDPDADLLIILSTPTKPFAPWDESENGAKGNDAPRPQTSELRIKASSKHLALASKHFRNKFAWEGEDTEALQSDGRIHIHLAGHDPKAVTIVMNIIHGRGRRVPKSVDLETLAKIALFVDAFQCYDAVEAYADRWVGRLENSLPSECSRDLVLWIFVAYVFHQPILFKSATRIAVLRSGGPIRDLGLPIREKLISKKYRPLRAWSSLLIDA